MRPSPPTHPSNQPSPHPNQPPSGQMMPGQVSNSLAYKWFSDTDTRPSITGGASETRWKTHFFMILFYFKIYLCFKRYIKGIVICLVNVSQFVHLFIYLLKILIPNILSVISKCFMFIIDLLLTYTLYATILYTFYS